MTLAEPCFPNEKLPARDFWPALEGRSLLQTLTDKPHQISEAGTNSWLVTLDAQWQWYSSQNDVFNTEHLARQRFFQAVQRQQQLLKYCSQPRCLAMMETGENEQWRLWQLIKLQPSLASLLEQALAQDSVQKIAAMLFVMAGKLIAFYQQLTTVELYLPLQLENIAIEQQKTIFVGFIPYTETPPIGSLADNLENSFQNTATAIINHPQLIATKILDYLKIHASDHPEQRIVVEVFAKLLSSQAL